MKTTAFSCESDQQGYRNFSAFTSMPGFPCPGYLPGLLREILRGNSSISGGAPQIKSSVLCNAKSYWCCNWLSLFVGCC